MKLKRMALPLLVALLCGAPAVAQVRVGVDAGVFHVRIAPDAPPPPRDERRMPRPSREHVWVGGYWDRRDNQWDWAPGRWEKPQQRGARWVKPQYHKDHGATRYHPGHWSHEKVVYGDEYTTWYRDHNGRR
jgi:hypothetical protein